jgi:uncharacterized protein YbjT (DUF2867 family)
MSRTILVTGATGYVGGRLVPRLLAAGYRVRCLTRDPARLAGRPWPGVEIVPGVMFEPGTLGPVLAGVGVAYYLVHSMAEGEAGFEERDRRAAANFAAAARDAGVQRIIYLGGLGREDLSPHLQSRQDVGRVLRESGVPLTEFRAAVIVGAGSMSFEMIRYLTERIPVMICPRWVDTPCQPLGIRNLLEYLIAALEEPRSAGRIIEIGGADVLTYGQMMLIYAEVRKLRRWMIRVPVLTPRLSSLWVGLVTPIPAAYARPLIEGLRSPVLVHDPSARTLFPQITPMSYREAVRLAVERLNLNAVETNWAGAYGPPPGGAGTTTLQTIEGLQIERREVLVPTDPATVYRVFSGIGGRRGWFYANWLWRARALLDRLVGGVGMRRGRRDPNALLPGDALDWWRVEQVEPVHMVRLRAEMKLPGAGCLDFSADPAPGGTLLRQTAYFQPRGLPGFLYWYGLYPVHRIIFKGMISALAARAVRAARRSARGRGHPAAAPRRGEPSGSNSVVRARGGRSRPH